jgi:endonuclease/exonuclease/phosphatase family metal-dependent hydrolase
MLKNVCVLAIIGVLICVGCTSDEESKQDTTSEVAVASPTDTPPILTATPAATLTLPASLLSPTPRITSVPSTNSETAMPTLIETRCLRISTLNIRRAQDRNGESSIEAIVTDLSSSGATFALLQEVNTTDSSEWGNQAELIAQQLGMDVAFFPDDDPSHGIAILSRLPISESQGQLLTEIDPQSRVLRIVVYTDSSPLYIYNVWLTPLQDGADNDDQGVETLREFIRDAHTTDSDARIVLGGAFNSVPEAAAYQVIYGGPGFVDPFSGFPIERLYTYTGDDGDIARLDYIGLRNLVPVGANTADNSYFEISDRRSSVVAFKIDENDSCQ